MTLRGCPFPNPWRLRWRFSGASFTPRPILCPCTCRTAPWVPGSQVGEWVLPDGREMLANDPMIFRDGERLYLYWGLGLGIFGAELDPEQTQSPDHHTPSGSSALTAITPGSAWAPTTKTGASAARRAPGCTRAMTESIISPIPSAARNFIPIAWARMFADSARWARSACKRSNPISRSDRGLVRGGGHGSIVDGPEGTIWCFYTIPVCYRPRV